MASLSGFLSRPLLLALGVGVLGGCVMVPPEESAPRVVYPQTTAAMPVLYFSAARGQPPAQRDRDRYTCSVWASQQTGFDPSLPSLATHQRVDVVMTPPGAARSDGESNAASNKSQADQYRRALIACLQAHGYQRR